MADLAGVIGEIGMTIQITRKETGKVEEYQLTGFVDEEQLKSLQEANLISKEQ